MKDQIEPVQTTANLDAKGQETLVALLGSKTKREACEKLSITYNALYDRIDKYGLDKIIAEIPKRALQTLQMGSELAAETMVKKLDGHQGLEAAKEILDRVGLTAKGGPQVLVQNNNQVNSIEFFTDESTPTQNTATNS